MGNHMKKTYRRNTTAHTTINGHAVTIHLTQFKYRMATLEFRYRRHLFRCIRKTGTDNRIELYPHVTLTPADFT